MSTRLVVLGLLRKRPLYGYEIKHMIEDHMGDWTNIAFGSIYFALRKLAEENLIEKVSTEQEGARPSRTVYQITDAGRAEFERLLREVWGNLEQQHFAIDIGLFFIGAIPRHEVVGYLRARIEQLEQVVAHVGTHRSEQLARDEVPAFAAAIFDHSLAHLEAELAWTRDVLDRIERGVYL
jgi:DNA-binding PadR family transcriptional regulator